MRMWVPCSHSLRYVDDTREKKCREKSLGKTWTTKSARKRHDAVVWLIRWKCVETAYWNIFIHRVYTHVYAIYYVGNVGYAKATSNICCVHCVFTLSFSHLSICPQKPSQSDCNDDKQRSERINKPTSVVAAMAMKEWMAKSEKLCPNTCISKRTPTIPPIGVHTRDANAACVFFFIIIFRAQLVKLPRQNVTFLQQRKSWTCGWVNDTVDTSCGWWWSFFVYRMRM